LDNHLAGVLFLTFISARLATVPKSGNVELPVDKQQRIASRLWVQVGFSRTGDPATGDFRDATVLRKFGDVPDDLSAL
jgi:hypothetical protein